MLWGFMIYAERATNPNHLFPRERDIGHGGAMIEADSEESARDLALKIAHKLYPTTARWSLHLAEVWASDLVTTLETAQSKKT